MATKRMPKGGTGRMAGSSKKKASKKKTTALNESPTERRTGNRKTEQRGTRTVGGTGQRTQTAPAAKRTSSAQKPRTARRSARPQKR